MTPRVIRLKIRQVAVLCVFFAVTATETINAAFRINKFLFASKERMAGAANTDAEVLDGGTRLIDSTTGALDDGFLVVGMDFSLHRTNEN